MDRDEVAEMLGVDVAHCALLDPNARVEMQASYHDRYESGREYRIRSGARRPRYGSRTVMQSMALETAIRLLEIACDLPDLRAEDPRSRAEAVGIRLAQWSRGGDL